MDIDILDGKTWDNGIFERMRWLRENAPVYRDEKNKLWVLSKYEDVAYVSKNNKIFCSGEGVRPNLPVKLSIIDMDEPRHAQLRGLVNRGFTPRMVGRLEAVFRGITTAAIDTVAKQGECDFVSSISVSVPLELIAELIGIRKGDRGKFQRWSDDMMAGDENFDQPEVMAKSGAAFTARRSSTSSPRVGITIIAT